MLENGAVTAPAFIAYEDLILDDFAAAARWHHRHQQEPHEEDFVVFRHMSGRNEMLVDGGANIGNSVVSFRLMNRAAPIVSFEPARWLEPALAYLHDHDPAMTYHLAGLSERRERVALYVPCLDRRPNFYLASALFSRFEEPRLTDVLRLMGAEPGQRFALCETEVELAPLDDFALAPTIIKLDVEDFEAQALRGAAATVGRHRPMVMVETANRQPEIVAFFADQRYRFCTRTGDQLRLDDGVTEASNGFYLAAERLDEYRTRGILRTDLA